MADDRDRTREDTGYRQSRPEDRRLGITGQPQSTYPWPSWINWALPLAALAGLLWYALAPDRNAQQYSDRGIQQQREPARTTTTPGGGTTTTTPPSGGTK